MAWIAAVAVGLLAIGVLTGRMADTSDVCGNNACEAGENPGICPQDCDSICGDAVCNDGENLTCHRDCTGNYTVPATEEVSLLDGILAWFK